MKKIYHVEEEVQFDKETIKLIGTILISLFSVITKNIIDTKK